MPYRTNISLARGLVLYVAGTLTTLLAGLLFSAPTVAFSILLAGRLLIGLGEAWSELASLPKASASPGRSARPALPRIPEQSARRSGTSSARFVARRYCLPSRYRFRRDWRVLRPLLSRPGLELCRDLAFGGGFVLVRLLFGHLPDRIGGLPLAIGSPAVGAVGHRMGCFRVKGIINNNYFWILS